MPAFADLCARCRLVREVESKRARRRPATEQHAESPE
jgi:hypothetical protein